MLVLAACAGPAAPPPPPAATLGDYGDAPDGGATGYAGLFAQAGAFPTLASSGGAVAQDVTQATLGPTASAEVDANDANDPDGQANLNPANTDADDGLVDFVLVLTSIPPPAALTVNVSAPAGSAGGQYFVNALIDMNLDGRWGGVASPGVPEWVVKNFPVQLMPSQATAVALPPFSFGFGNRLPDGAWMRILLSREAVSGGDWNGGGTFSAGEVEDHVIRLPVLQGGQKRLIIQMSCPRTVRFPRGAAAVNFTCQVFNTALGATAGRFSYFMVGIGPNAASVAVAPRGGAAAIGCVPARFPAGGPVNCGVPPATIPIAGAGPVNLRLRAARQAGGPLPSTWTYSATGEDPPAIVTAEGVTVGFGDARGDVAFVAEEPMPYGELRLYPKEAVIVVQPKNPKVETPMEISIGPGESFRGLKFEDLTTRRPGRIELPPMK